MFIHVYFVLKLVAKTALPFELKRLYSDLSHYIKEHQNAIYCLNFLKKFNDLFGTYAY